MTRAFPNEQVFLPLKSNMNCGGGGDRMRVVECRMQPHHYPRTIISNELSVLPLFQDCDCCKE